MSEGYLILDDDGEIRPIRQMQDRIVIKFQGLGWDGNHKFASLFIAQQHGYVNHLAQTTASNCYRTLAGTGLSTEQDCL